jgi:hypothetical protein
MSSPEASKTPYRQIRAVYDKETITVYQAYSASIAEAAVREQKLYASPDFLFTRMTWIKPSWFWMMYFPSNSLLLFSLFKPPVNTKQVPIRLCHER